MTLHEIEETLQTLQSRHEGLNEGMLVTLLRAGGWEEKNIQEAVLLFRSGGVVKSDQPKKETQALPSIQEEPVFPAPTDEKHLLLDHNKDDQNPEERTVAALESSPAPEPQSLIQNQDAPVRQKKDEIPHNLPIRPFETSDHVWPFSRYRDVFFGESEGEIKEAQAAVVPGAAGKGNVKEEMRVENPIVIPQEEVVNNKKEEVVLQPIIVPAPVPKKELAPAPLTKTDERLVVIAAIMLVAILLLLGYMYSNGRL